MNTATAIGRECRSGRADPAGLRALLVGIGQPTQRLQTSLCEAGVAVEVAGSADRAKPHLWRLDLDVVLLSLSPAEGRLLDAISAWRRAGLVTPVLACAARRDQVRCLDAGADRCMPDDVAAEELLAWLSALVRRRPVLPSVLRVYDLLIPVGSRAVQRGGRDIRLTRREYELLTFLAYHRGKVVSRALIHEQIYGEHDSVSSNTVDVYIRYLRNKIDRGFDPPLILTHWGEGYLLRGGD